MKVRNKPHLDELVSSETGVGYERVREITAAFLDHILESLVDFDEVQLAGYFRLKLKVYKGPETPRKLSVVTRRAPGKKLVRSKVMKVDRQYFLLAKKSTSFAKLIAGRHGPSAHGEGEAPPRKGKAHGKVRR